jgi:hypothetical protein
MQEVGEMKKIPTMFVREHGKMVSAQVAKGCEWVYEEREHVTATAKIDGTCCAILGNGEFVRRRRVKPGKDIPEGFILVEEGPEGSLWGWVPVAKEDGPWLEGFAHLAHKLPGTYELIGPKIQGNPYQLSYELSGHMLLRHGQTVLDFCVEGNPYLACKKYLEAHGYEGVVFWHDDGRKAKIKRRDFGLEWPLKASPT